MLDKDTFENTGKLMFFRRRTSRVACFSLESAILSPKTSHRFPAKQKMCSSAPPLCLFDEWQYFLKETEFWKATAAEVKRAEGWIVNYLRKILGWPPSAKYSNFFIFTLGIWMKFLFTFCSFCDILILVVNECFGKTRIAL